MIRRLFIALVVLAGFSAAASAQTTCGPLPYNFATGVVIQAPALNANFTTLRNCINVNATLPWDLNLKGNGIFTVDGAVVGIRNEDAVTAHSIYSGVTPAGFAYSDVTRSVLAMENGSTVTNANAYGAYVLNRSPHGSSGAHEANAVGYFGVGISAVDHAHTWGLNLALDDNTVNSVITTVDRQEIGAEFDFYTNGAATIVEGIGLILNGGIQPAGANGVQISIVSGSPAKWTNGFVVDNGASSVGLIVGALATSGTSINSQPIELGGFDSGGVGFYSQLVSINHSLAYIDDHLAHGISLTASAGAPTISPNGVGNIDMNVGCNGACTLKLRTNNVDSLTIDSAQNATFNGSFGGSAGKSQFFGDSAATFPTSASTSYAISDNFSNTDREVDFWNRDQIAGGSFRWYQKTSPSVATLLASLSATGLFDAVAYSVGGTPGASCAVTTPAHITAVNGLVTVCN